MTSNHDNQEDYISLESIKSIIFSFFKHLFAVLDSIGLVLKRGWMILLILGLLGAGIAFLDHRYVPREYKLSMIVQYTDLSKMTYYEIFSQLNEMAKSQSYEKLAAELGLDTITTRQISAMEITGLNGETLEKDTSTVKDLPLLITVDTRANSSLYEIQTAILNYLNNNDYAKQLKEGEKKIYEEKLAYIDLQLQKMDSLKDAYTRSINAGRNTGTIYYNAFNPAELYLQSNTLLALRQEAKRWLIAKDRTVKLINGFKPVGSSSSNQLMKFTIKGLLIGLLLGILITFWIELRASVTNSKKKELTATGQN
jgi:hypothetical protein